MRYTDRIKSVLMGMLIVLTFLPQQAGAVGLAPAPVEVQSILNNTKLKRDIVILRANPSLDETAQVAVDGEYARFIFLPNNGVVPLPKGMLQVSYSLYVQPANLPAGRYEVPLTMSIRPPERSPRPGERVSNPIDLGVGSKIVFTVTTDEVENFLVQNLSVGQAEEFSPLTVSFETVNTGNVEGRPQMVSLRVRREDKQETVFEYTWEKAEIPPTDPLANQVITLATEHTLKKGMYVATLTGVGMKDSAPVVSEAHFEIFAAGTLGQSLELDSVFFESQEIEQGSTAILYAEAKNTGKIPVKAKLQATLRRKGSVVRQSYSSERVIPAGERYKFDLALSDLEQSGTYEVDVLAEYGMYRTNIVKRMFLIKGGRWGIVLWVFSASVLCALGIVFMWWRKSHSQSKRRLKSRKTKDLS
jgi:hypothetical protein